MYPHQQERLTAALGRHGLEAVVASSAANLAYVIGASVGLAGPAAAPAKRPALIVMAPSGTALVIADGTEAPTGVDHVIPYERDAIGPALASPLDALGASEGAVALDTGGLAPAMARKIATALGAHNVVEGSGVLLDARLVKSPWEIETIERALLAAEHGLNEVVQRLEPGMTEREATAIFEAEVTKHRATPRVSRIAFGQATADFAAAPSSRRLSAGDLVRLDVGCTADGYHAEVARTAVMGDTGERDASVVDALARGVEEAIAAMHAGARAGTVTEAALKTIRRNGIPDYQVQAIGHGIGLDLEEPPSLEPMSEVTLEAEMVLVVDLSHADPTRGAARITETVLVGRRSARSLNRSQRGLLVL